ncbi:DUF4410 domain-containing protein [Lysobacter sp. KIS68-7]|uniref:DUF4410 domain-containing protein n=1 Tax=Lysobacter sp. KIS68-7 TaxID=2904252 RepID=UPI001E5F77FD|nr:DUF4410 domain-containing protein [Lysobacter sp. KIS68-7]UHQ19858.1 DUF4410 domain-containing protein [Lysobacter sp. KIS68-7]
MQVMDVLDRGKLACLLSCAILAATAGCATTPSPRFEQSDTTQAVVRPERILVYDFVGTRDELPPDTQIASAVDASAPAQSADDVALGKQLGQQVAQRLVARLRSAGIDAYPVAYGPVPKVGDVVVRGEFVSVDTGSRSMRVLVGFGAGRAQMSTLVETYQITAAGPRPLASAQADTQGGRLPGVLLPIGLAGMGTNAAVSGASNVMQERGAESIRGAAQRTADGIADSIIAIYRDRGWK